MESVADTTPKKTYFSQLFRVLAKWWTIIITIGVSAALTHRESKRVRLLNGICLMSFLILAIYCLSYLDIEHRLTFWESFVGVVANCIPVFLNYKHRYAAARHFFCIYNLLYYSFLAISHGQVDAVEYILVANSIASMLFFKKIRIIVTYFLLNALFFAACKYSFSVMKPFLFMPAGENLSFGNHVTLFVIVFLIVYYFKTENERQESKLETQNVHLAEEKEKSDNLLLNILPYETAEELKQTGTAKAKSFDSVSVMFTDFKDFTRVSEQLSPHELVKQINFCYSAFDKIIARHHIEKIKTIGDSYMCAGGLPIANDTHAENVVTAALEIRDFMLREKEKYAAKGKPFFDIRIGCNTGPVVAGIVGIKKFAYDIWGDVVNIASRMESSGEAGKINISGSTYELVKDKFACTHRGKIKAKNKGMIDMYFVERL